MLCYVLLNFSDSEDLKAGRTERMSGMEVHHLRVDVTCGLPLNPHNLTTLYLSSLQIFLGCRVNPLLSLRLYRNCS